MKISQIFPVLVVGVCITLLFFAVEQEPDAIAMSYCSVISGKSHADADRGAQTSSRSSAVCREDEALARAEQDIAETNADLADDVTPEKFLATLPAVLGSYDEERLQALLEAFNRKQQTKYGADDLSNFTVQEGYTQFNAVAYQDYFILDGKVVEQAHTEGIDAGVDGHVAIVFAKAPLREIVRLEGPAYPFKNQNLILSAPAHSSCLDDMVPVGSVSVFDLARGKEIFRSDLLPGTISLGGVSSSRDDAIGFVTVDETAVSASAATKGCDVGERVRIRTNDVEVRCQPQSGVCRMVRKTMSAVQGCPSIGGCD